jgi:hypothetical protein
MQGIKQTERKSTYLSTDEVQFVDLILQLFGRGQIGELRSNGTLEFSWLAIGLDQLFVSYGCHLCLALELTVSNSFKPEFSKLMQGRTRFWDAEHVK